MIRTADMKHLINNSILSRLINITAGSILLSIGGKKCTDMFIMTNIICLVYLQCAVSVTTH